MSIDGNWNCTMDTPLGERKVLLSLTANGSELSGTLSDGSAGTPIQDGRVEGDNASWKADINSPMSMTLEFTVTVTANEMAGSVKLGIFGSAPLRGTRA
jgi:hypothetical protein